MIKNAANIPLNFKEGTVPDVSGAMLDWFQPMTFTLVTKKTTAFQVVETPRPINFMGVIQPLTERQLLLKPEGQRAWTWFLLHSDTSLVLQVDDVVLYQGVQTRVMGRKNYVLYGYQEYSLVQDWTNAGPG